MEKILKRPGDANVFSVPYFKTTKSIPMEKWTAQNIYSKLIKLKTQPPTSFSKWPMDDIVLYDLISQNYEITNHTKILDTQYRITNRYYHTEYQLFTWKIKESPACVTCGWERDTIEHHFVQCPQKIEFWRKIDLWKQNVIDIDINESVYDKLLGIHNPNNIVEIDFINFINLCCKVYFRESEEADIFLSVFLQRMKYWARSIRNPRLKEFYEDLFD